MGTFNPAEFAAQCQVPQSQLPDNYQDDSGWNTQQGKDADSPSVGRDEIPSAQRDEALQGAAETGKARTAQEGPLQFSGQSDAGRGDDEEQGRGDDFLEPLPGSPDGLAPADLLGNENPTAAAFEAHARPAEALPLTQAPDMHNSMGPSQDAFATQQTPEKAAHEDGDNHGAGRSQSFSQRTTMFGKGLRAVLSPFGIGRLSGIFGDKGRGYSQKGSSQAEASQPEAGIPQHRNTVPATPLGPSQEGTGPMASLSNSPRGAAVRQGLDIIEQAHRLGGGAKLRMAGPVAPSSGSGKAAASTSAAAGSTDAHPLEVDETSGPITAPVEVDGQTVNAILLQPMTAEAATEAAGHQMLAPSGVPPGVDCIAVAPILAPESAPWQQAPATARPSRKRMEPGADAPGAAAAASQGEGTVVGAPGSEPRQQKRRLLTGMAVVWRYFGIKDPKATPPPTG